MLVTSTASWYCSKDMERDTKRKSECQYSSVVVGVLLDNSPLHRSQEFIRHIAQWVKRGLIIKYLPPYSPELNLIELLWRFIKYHWLPFSAYMSFPCLVQAVEDILTRFGTDYTINFQAT